MTWPDAFAIVGVVCAVAWLLVQICKLP